MLHITSICLNLVGSMMLVAFGIRYLVASRAMPYHLVAMEKTWDDVDSGTRAILTALMRCVGAAFLAVGVASLWIVCCALSRREIWANIGLVCVYVVLLIPVTAAMRRVRRRTRGRPPIAVSLVGLLLGLLAFGLECLSFVW